MQQRKQTCVQQQCRETGERESLGQDDGEAEGGVDVISFVSQGKGGDKKDRAKGSCTKYLASASSFQRKFNSENSELEHSRNQQEN